MNDRKLTATGTIKFTPDLRAAVEVDYSILGAYKSIDGAMQPYEDVQTEVRNYTKSGNNNPKIIEFPSIVYQDLKFNPGANNVNETAVTLTFKFTNRSARTDKNMKVTFNNLSSSTVKPSGSKVTFSLVPSNMASISPGGSSGNVMITLFSDLTQSSVEFNFEFIFDFVA